MTVCFQTVPMSEVSCSPISAAGLNRELHSKTYIGPYSFISENAFVKPDNESKDSVNLKKAVSRLEQNIDFMQHEHCQMLAGLQKQIEKLREENQGDDMLLIWCSEGYGGYEGFVCIGLRVT